MTTKILTICLVNYEGSVYKIDHSGADFILIGVTRFDKISPLLQNFKSLWLFFLGIFYIGQNVFIVVNGPILKSYFNCLVTLILVQRNEWKERKEAKFLNF